MIDFPDVQSDYLFGSKSKANREQWLKEVIVRTHDWIQTGGDIYEWMNSFCKLREQLLKCAWGATIPVGFQETASYILFGSGGRSEDLLYSDLDHGILIHGTTKPEELQPYIYTYLQIMAELGCPPCQGFVMGTNPRWIGIAAAWKERVRSYFDFPDWEHVRYLFMLVDTRLLHDDPLHPSSMQWQEIKGEVLKGIQQSAFIRWEMAHLGIYRSVALGVFRRLKSKREENREVIDIKEGLLNPLIHSLRLLAVANGCHELSSFERINFLAHHEVLQNDWKKKIEAALKFGWKMRLKARLSELRDNQAVTDLVNLSIVGKKEKEELMSHLEIAKRLERWTHSQFRKPR